MLGQFYGTVNKFPESSLRTDAVAWYENRLRAPTGTVLCINFQMDWLVTP